MKATTTIKPDSSSDFSSKIEDWQLSQSDHIAHMICKYYASQSRAYKTYMGISLDTVGIHSDGDSLGIRFYHQTMKAHNPRKSLKKEFRINIEDAAEQINAVGLPAYCNSIADTAVKDIQSQMKQI